MGMVKMGGNTNEPNEDSKLSRLEYAIFDERRGIVKSLEECGVSFQKFDKRIRLLEKGAVAKSLYLRILISVGTVIVVLVEVYQGFLALK